MKNHNVKIKICFTNLSIIWLDIKKLRY
jgi:hypothetical protein